MTPASRFDAAEQHVASALSQLVWLDVNLDLDTYESQQALIYALDLIEAERDNAGS